ncbi:MAG: hypothetical protein EXR62_01235 [Chloroflexi bacterium]|nr:hypothetical protein [Chloroflexota bacterium]
MKDGDQSLGGQPRWRATLMGRKLTIARLAWLMGAFLTLLLFVISITVRIDEDISSYQQIESRLAELGLSYPLLAYYPLLLFMADIFTTLAFCATGAFIFWRKSNDWIGLVVSFALISFGCTITLPLDLNVTRPLWQIPVIIGRGLGISSFLVFLYLFPTGYFVPRWTRYLAVLFCIWSISWVFFLNSPLNPYTWGELPNSLVILGWFATGLAAQFYRYLRISRSMEQQQTKWIVFGVTVPFLVTLVFNLSNIVLPTIDQANLAMLVYGLISRPLFLVALLLIPVSITISILRYRLWDIDLIINRALVFGLLTVMLGTVYLVSVVALQQAFRMVTGQTSDLAIVYSTLAIAALFTPLRRTFQTMIDRRFYRHKYDAAKTLEAFSATVRDEVDLNKLNEDLLGVVEEAMQPMHVSLWLPHSGGKS